MKSKKKPAPPAAPPAADPGAVLLSLAIHRATGRLSLADNAAGGDDLELIRRALVAVLEMVHQRQLQLAAGAGVAAVPAGEQPGQ